MQVDGISVDGHHGHSGGPEGPVTGLYVSMMQHIPTT